jgi:putative addiction module antidote
MAISVSTQDEERYTFCLTPGARAMKLEVKKIGNSTGLILPKELMTRLNLAQGDWLHVTESSDGSVRLTPYDPVFEKGMAVAERAMKTYRNALAELAK